LLKEKKYYIERDAHKLLFGLFSQVFGIHQKQDTTGIGKFQQTVNCVDGGEGFFASGSHLNQGTGSVFLKRFFEIVNGPDPAIPKSFDRQIGQLLQTLSEADFSPYFFFQGLRFVKGNYVSCAGFGIPKIGKTGDDPGAFISFFMAKQLLRWL